MTTTKQKRMPPGIYFGLDAATYHADPALGSGDFRRLIKGVAAFWHESKFNPDRPRDKKTEAKTEGSAVHKIVLEGIKPFQKIYKRRPDDPEGATGPEKGSLTKKFKATLRDGDEMLHGEAYDRTLMVAGEIAANPDLASAFQGGMPEVAVFWEEPGIEGMEPVPCKALLDYLKIRGTGDIKTIANELRLEFTLACRRTIRYSRLPIQAALYWRGRARFAGFVAQGLVDGDHDAAWLAKVAATKPLEIGWQWVFYQREGAPEVWSKTLSPRNPIFARAAFEIDEALLRYQRALIEFGDGMPWRTTEPVSELTEDEIASLAGDY